MTLNALGIIKGMVQSVREICKSEATKAKLAPNIQN
jgi:hypothetical protein